MGFRRVRYHAHAVLGEAQGTMSRLEQLATALIEDAVQFLEEAQEFKVTFHIEEGYDLMDLLRGKTRELPISIKVELKDD